MEDLICSLKSFSRRILRMTFGDLIKFRILQRDLHTSISSLVKSPLLSLSFLCDDDSR